MCYHHYGIGLRLTKRLTVLLLLSLALPRGLPALDISAGVRLGVCGSFLGGSYADELSTWMTDQGAGRVSPRLYASYQAGLAARMRLSRHFALQAEVNVGPVGGGLLASEGFNVLVGVSALELGIPILAVVLLDTRIGTVSLFAGPFGAISIGAPILVQNDGAVRSQSDLAASPATIGIIAGAGFQFPLGMGWLTGDLRYTHRFLTIIDTGAAGTALTPLAAALTAGYMIPVGAGKARK